MIVPESTVDLNGTPTISWAKINLATGEYIGVNEDGGNEGAFEFVGLVAEGIELTISVVKYFSPIMAFDTGAVLSVAYELTVSNRSQPEAAVRLAAQKEQAQELYKQLIENSEAVNLILSSDSVAQKVIGKINGAKNDTVYGASDRRLGAAEEHLQCNPGCDHKAIDWRGSRRHRLSHRSAAALGVAGKPDERNHQCDEPAFARLDPGSGADDKHRRVAANQRKLVFDGDQRFEATNLSAAAATVVDSSGNTVGTGPSRWPRSGAVALGVSGNDQFSVNGTGSLSAYGPAETGLGVSGNWDSYSATVTGSVTITLTTDGLTLNGTTLPAGTYKITTASAALSGSGQTTSPNFSGSMSITATGGVVSLGPGSGNISAAGTPLDPTNGVTLDGYTGTISVSANGNATRRCHAQWQCRPTC